jgi:acyl-CoA thioesterase YciA
MESTDTETQDMETHDTGPRGDLALRMVAMPADTNPSGDIFGG